MIEAADKKTIPLPLDDLASQAELQDSAAVSAADGSAGEPAAEALSNEQALAGAIGMARDVFCGFTGLASPKNVLTDPAVEQLANLWAPVLRKHNIELGRYLGDYGLEIAAVMASFAIVAQLRQAVSAEISARKQQIDKPAEQNALDGDGSTQG